ncbi:hypothetical protein [Mesorhizobium sp. B2-1-2]|uniref:hypothetical protein n=1 Tax=Mesorhizobium sp. B2-1-2 TaxID=2589973 RepID=UPI0011277A0F|nr:hypothetical protein [Mesorhizobium sp. B2-1-2]TPN11705.1 hypothetical protein FJ971_09870 [Mesorhizobium sp. B2-1-2]
MRAVDRTMQLLVASIREALPGMHIGISRSCNAAGRSNYVYIHAPGRTYKIRISDHAIGMRRALSGREDLYIPAGAKPASWAVWLGNLVATLQRAAA